MRFVVTAGLAAGAQRVLFAGRQLEDSSVLAQSGVADEDTLYILARLMGGAKKRKKKTYTKPKKQKHKHKKIKLRVLKFFKVWRLTSSTCLMKSTLFVLGADFRTQSWYWRSSIAAQMHDCGQ